MRRTVQTVAGTDYVPAAETDIRCRERDERSAEAARWRCTKGAWAQLGDKMSVAAGLRAARASVKRRNNVRLELDRLHGSRWISDVARLRFGKCRQRQRRARGMQALPIGG